MLIHTQLSLMHLHEVLVSDILTILSCYKYDDLITLLLVITVNRKAKKARRILDRMIDAYKSGKTACKPNIYAFNAVLSASCHTHQTRFAEERVEAFTILVSTFLLLREWTEPNDVTYALFFKACERLLPRGHRLCK